MKHVLKISLVGMLLISMCLFCVACSKQTVFAALASVASVANATADTILTTSGVDSATAATVKAWVGVVAEGLGAASTALSDDVLTPAEIVTVANTLTKATVPALPVDVPDNYKSAITALSKGVDVFLQIWKEQAAATGTYGAGKYGGVRLKPNDKDHNNLELARADIVLIGYKLQTAPVVK